MDSLPDELITNIVSNVSAHDLTQLSLTCKRLSRLADPQLWTNLEFHHPSFHKWLEAKHPPPLMSASCRFYHAPQQYFSLFKADKFFKMLQSYLSQDEDRLKELCARVKSLCTAVRSPIDIWQFLPYFTNLEALELHGGFWYSDEDKRTSFDVSAPPLPRLRFAKLLGNIPRAVATWILESSAKLERLELGMVDRGIASKSTIEDDFSRLPEDVYSPDDWPTYGRLSGWAAIPRPLGGFLPLRDNGGCSLTLPRLRHLSLCQPSQGDLSSRMVSYFWSTSAEVAAHADWEQILLASRQTLETLVLEQRIGIEHGDGACGDSEYFLKDDDDGLGSKGLIDLVEEILTEETFPELRRVYLRGIVVGSDARGKPIGDVPGGRFMRFLESINVKCEARLGEGCWFDGESGDSFWAHWEASGHDEDEDEDEDEEADELLARV
ncbi:hypothetical protein ACJ41O_015370 [Fusarium nematophilum]